MRNVVFAVIVLALCGLLVWAGAPQPDVQAQPENTTMGGRSSAGGATAQSSSISPKTTPSPAAPKIPTPAPAPPPSSGTLMSAGGSVDGPVPLMSDGSCPKEFPDLRNGACYSA
jgi:hypothetical protein